MKAPFPWFGGKSRVAHLVWDRFGNVPNYVEPFFGSGAVLLDRPHAPHTETINMRELAERLRRVRVCCGNWDRICGPSPTIKHGITGVFLDPPYADAADRTQDLYAADYGDVAHAVRSWAVEW